MEDKVKVLITHGVGIEGEGKVPGEIVEVSLKLAATLKSLDRAVDGTDENISAWKAIHQPGTDAPSKKSKKNE